MTQTTEAGAPAETVGDGLGLAAQDYETAKEKLTRRAGGPVESAARRLALGTVQDMIGFWALWHLEGGSAGLQRLGMPRATIYRKISLFRESFGEHPDVFKFPGLIPDAEAYLEAFGVPAGEGPGMPRVLAGGREGPARLPR